MRKRKHKYLIIILILLFISIGFAYLTSTLDIVGIGHLRKATWKIYFDNVNIVEGENLSSNPPTTSNHNTTSVSYTVNMTKPGDTYKFYIDIVNNGTIDAMVSLIDENTILTSDQSKYASYSISYIDGSPIEENNFLGKHSKETLQVIIKYKKDVTSSDLPTQAMNLSFNLSLTYKQAKNADSRRGESTIITDLSGNNNHGTLYGGRINADGSVYLDGIDDFIDCGLANYDFGDSMSYVIKLKIHGIDPNKTYDIFNNYTSNSGSGITLSKTSNKFWTGNYAGGVKNGFSTSYKPNENEYITIVSTYDGNSIKFYVNGTKQTSSTDNTVTEKSAQGDIAVSDAPITIGGKISGNDVSGYTGNFFSNITVAEAILFDRGLTEEEIATDYATDINPTNTSNMLLRYQFKNTIVKDLSGNNNDLTLVKVEANPDGSLYFNGTNAKASAGLDHYNFGNQVSFIARAQVHTLNSYETYFINNYESGGLGLMTLYEKLCFQTHLIGIGYVRYCTNITPELNKWYTLVGTYDGTRLKYYINGKEYPEKNSGNLEVLASGNITVSPAFIELGVNAYTYPNTINSPSEVTISDALIFKRAITKDEVINDYAKTISPSNRENLFLYYHFG